MLSRLYLLTLTSGLVCACICLTLGSASTWGAPQTEDEDQSEVATVSAEAAESVDGESVDGESSDGESSDGEKNHGLIDFARDVQPILTDKCLECHGPKKAKNDFRVDDAALLLSYIEPGNVADSSLWTDYLIGDDPDMHMPPTTPDYDRPLTAAELATIKLWIEEGGMWDLVSEDVEHAEEVVPASMAERVWRFQGLFHPATVHFPIALLTVSALFVFLSFFRPDTCEPVAFHCLWIGALGAIVSSAAGWSYAPHEGYVGFSFDLFNSPIDRHRWLGIAVAVLATGLVPVAMYVRRTEDFGMRFIWFVGSLLLMAGVGFVGFQGGELTYGEGHYEKALVKLFPEAFVEPKKDDAQEGDATEHDAQENTSEAAEAVTEKDTAPADSSAAVEVDEPKMDSEAGTTEPTAEPDESSEPPPQVAPPQADASDAADATNAADASESAADSSSGDATSNDAPTPPAAVQPAEPADQPLVQPKPAVVF